MSPEETAYFDRLYARGGSAVWLDPRRVTFRNGSAPEQNKCHENADRWVDENPQCAAVRGWVIEAESGDHRLFVAHSVIVDDDGVMFDITLEQPHRFLPHDGEPALFDRLRVNHAQRGWPPTPLDDRGGEVPPEPLTDRLF